MIIGTNVSCATCDAGSGRAAEMMSMGRLVALLLSALFVASVIGTAKAEILIKIDKSSQRMTVSNEGEVLYAWPVSTGRTGHATPSGAFSAFRIDADHYSKEWDNAPMPHSIFFTKLGHAIHGTYDTKELGTPASHGCVRLSPAHAAILFAMVKQNGVTNTKVVLTGSEQIAIALRGSETRRPEDISRSNYADRNAQFLRPQSIQPEYQQSNSVQSVSGQSQIENPNFGHGQFQ
jgi:hypothetical protein